MARDLITPVKSSDMSSGACRMTSGNMIKVSTANGAYIKTGGSSNIDASRLLFVLKRTTAGGNTTGVIDVVSGSTAGKDDFEPGKYSTLNNLRIKVTLSSVAGARYSNYIYIKETARFKDTDGYIKFNFSTALSSGGGTTERTLMGAIYLKK